MRKFVSPVCLVLSILLFGLAIGVMANDGTVHPAADTAESVTNSERLESDESKRDTPNTRWRRRSVARQVLIGSLFGLAVIVASVGLLSFWAPWRH